jgi:hypothetical protein
LQKKSWKIALQQIAECEEVQNAFALRGLKKENFPFFFVSRAKCENKKKFFR